MYGTYCSLYHQPTPTQSTICFGTSTTNLWPIHHVAWDTIDFCCHTHQCNRSLADPSKTVRTFQDNPNRHLHRNSQETRIAEAAQRLLSEASRSFAVAGFIRGFSPQVIDPQKNLKFADQLWILPKWFPLMDMVFFQFMFDEARWFHRFLFSAKAMREILLWQFGGSPPGSLKHAMRCFEATFACRVGPDFRCWASALQKKRRSTDNPRASWYRQCVVDLRPSPFRPFKRRLAEISYMFHHVVSLWFHGFTMFPLSRLKVQTAPCSWFLFSPKKGDTFVIFPKQLWSWMGFSILPRNGLCSIMIFLVRGRVPGLVSLLFCHSIHHHFLAPFGSG